MLLSRRAVSLLALVVLGGVGPATAAGAARAPHVNAARAKTCDFIVGGSTCLAPFPDDYYTVATRKTATGRRVHIARSAMPANTKGVHIDPAQWNRNDGFSPGITIIIRIPGLDNQAAFTRTGLVPVRALARYRQAAQSVVVVDAKTHQRWPIWAELDANAASDAQRNLEIHPARNFLEGHRYIVAF